MIKLTPEEKEFIENREEEVAEIVRRLEAIRAFKLGDYLVAYHHYEPHHVHRMVMPKKDELIVNSYGLPKKFRVIHVDKNGVPYVKELNKNGKPHGRLKCAVTIGDDHDDMVFQVDPDYEDSLIMGDNDGFSATATHKERANTFKEICEHNRQSRVNNKDMNELVSFINSLAVGSTIWRSSTNVWTITKIGPIPRDATNRVKNQEAFIEVQDSKGRMISVAFWDLKNKIIYRDRPRSYKELRNI